MALHAAACQTGEALFVLDFGYTLWFRVFQGLGARVQLNNTLSAQILNPNVSSEEASRTEGSEKFGGSFFGSLSKD